MSFEVRELAESLRLNERTLRRAWSLGALRGERVSPHKLHLPVQERAYLRQHWSTINRLRSVLRTEPNVSIAVLFGSVARGDDHLGSDVDLMIGMRDAGLRPDLDEQALEAAWASDDPSERNRADGVLASFEKTYMLLGTLE